MRELLKMNYKMLFVGIAAIAGIFLIPLLGSDSSRVVFLGDNIVQVGRFRAAAQIYRALRCPSEPMRLFNCGIVGDTALDGLQRLERDGMARKPQMVFLMFGLSDIRKNIKYSKSGGVIDPAAMKNFQTGIDALVEKLQASGCKVVLVSPFPYDQYSDIGIYNAKLNQSPGLADLSRMLQKIAETRKIRFLDVHTELSKILQNEEMELFVKNNREVPNTCGHIALGLLVASELGVGQEVASVHISLPDRKISTSHAKVEALRQTPAGICFLYKPEALPLPVEGYYRKLKKPMNLSEKFNREWLSVSGLSAGQYELSANGNALGVYSAETLASGVNIAELDTPSQRLAREMFGLLNRLENAPQTQRKIAKAESMIAAHDGNLENIAENGRFLDEFASKVSRDKTYYADIAANYRKNAPRKDALEKNEAEYVDQLYRRAQPRPFLIELKKLNP